MVQLRPLTDDDTPHVLTLRVAPDQSPFVNPIADIFATRVPGEDFYGIEANGRVVGFFKIEVAEPGKYGHCQGGELVLRSFFVDAGRQRKGYGRGACVLLPGFLKRRYPDRTAVVLTVNHKNPVARGLYEEIGFVVTSEPYLGGPSGPQAVMFLPL